MCPIKNHHVQLRLLTQIPKYMTRKCPRHVSCPDNCVHHVCISLVCWIRFVLPRLLRACVPRLACSAFVRETDFGYLTLISGYEHGLLHCARHIVAGSSELIYDTDNGRSGMVACLLLLPIVLPMKFEFFRTKVGNWSLTLRMGVLYISWTTYGPTNGECHGRSWVRPWLIMVDHGPTHDRPWSAMACLMGQPMVGCWPMAHVPWPQP